MVQKGGTMVLAMARPTKRKSTGSYPSRRASFPPLAAFPLSPLSPLPLHPHPARPRLRVEEVPLARDAAEMVGEAWGHRGDDPVGSPQEFIGAGNVWSGRGW